MDHLDFLARLGKRPERTQVYVAPGMRTVTIEVGPREIGPKLGA